jgi:predicted Fe-Mo cluster-binding NifX family protein
MQGAVKIAAVTNDGITITGHFGMAEYYRIIGIEAGKVTTQEQRPKPHHALHPDYVQAEHHEHQDMFAPIRDCQVLLCGGMRTPAYEKAEAIGLQVIMTSGRIDEAVQAYLNGTVINDPRRIHNH